MAFSTGDRIGLVGAGAMGLPLARHLVGAGFPVTVCDLEGVEQRTIGHRATVRRPLAAGQPRCHG